MWATTFLIAAWLTITPPVNLVSDSTSVMLLEFSVSMDTAGLFNKDNYSIVDNHGNSVPIYDIEIVNTLDGISIQDTSLIAIVIPKPVFKRSFTTTVSNLVDVNGRALDTEKNSAWYFNSGFTPNLITVPELHIRKER